MTTPARNRRLALLLAACAVALAGPAGAGAHGDPATHFLELESLYPAVADRPTPELELQLLGLLQAVDGRGYGIKVALVANEADLEEPELLTQPQRYAEHLARELRPRAPLVVITSGGFGLSGHALRDGTLRAVTRADAAALLRGIPPPASARGDDLARTAMLAVRRLAREAGRPLPAYVAPARVVVPPRAAGGSRWSADHPLVLAGVFGTLFALSWVGFELWTRLHARRRPMGGQAGERSG